MISLQVQYLHSIGTWEKTVNIYSTLDEETWKLAERRFPYCSEDCEHLLSWMRCAYFHFEGLPGDKAVLKYLANMSSGYIWAVSWACSCCPHAHAGSFMEQLGIHPAKTWKCLSDKSISGSAPISIMGGSKPAPITSTWPSLQTPT